MKRRKLPLKRLRLTSPSKRASLKLPLLLMAKTLELRRAKERATKKAARRVEQRLQLLLNQQPTCLRS